MCTTTTLLRWLWPVFPIAAKKSITAISWWNGPSSAKQVVCCTRNDSILLLRSTTPKQSLAYTTDTVAVRRSRLTASSDEVRALRTKYCVSVTLPWRHFVFFFFGVPKGL